MPKTTTAPAPYCDEQPLAINMQAVESNQVAAIGYDPETKTLAVPSRAAWRSGHLPNAS